MPFFQIIGTLAVWVLLVPGDDAKKSSQLLFVCWIWFEHGTLRTFFPRATGEAAYIRGNCVSFTHSPPVCSVVLIKCLEIKSVAQVPSAQKSFLKQIPELSTHPPCNWLPSALYWIVFKQIKPKLEQGGDNSWSHCTQTGGLLSSHYRDRYVFSLYVLAIKKSQPWSKSHGFPIYTLLKGWEKHEACHLGPSSVKGKKKEPTVLIKAFPGLIRFPRRCFWKHSLFWE